MAVFKTQIPMNQVFICLLYESDSWSVAQKPLRSNTDGVRDHFLTYPCKRNGKQVETSDYI